MRLVTFVQPGSVAQAGILDGNLIRPLGVDMISVIARGQTPQSSARPVEAASTQILAPVPRPPKFICVGLNYRDHAAEARIAIHPVPVIFSKFSSVVVGPGADVVLPRVSSKPDYEAEFAFVIGPGGRHISAAKAMDHVFGYTIVNDVSARDYQAASTQLLLSKSFDTFGPMGPYLTTRDEIADPHQLDISLEIGGEVLQKSNTRELVFKIPELIEYISTVVTLEPGDVVATGTPAGVGFGRKPPRWLRPGDEMIVRIQGLGELRNRCVSEP